MRKVIEVQADVVVAIQCFGHKLFAASAHDLGPRHNIIASMCGAAKCANGQCREGRKERFHLGFLPDLRLCPVAQPKNVRSVPPVDQHRKNNAEHGHFRVIQQKHKARRTARCHQGRQ